jgi:hypothetical protein
MPRPCGKLVAVCWVSAKGLDKDLPGGKFKEGDGTWELIVPSDGEVAWGGWDDLCQGLARTLSRFEEYSGQTLRLTVRRATRINEVAEIADKETGVDMKAKFVGQDTAKDWHL